ncbi:hypothetical protein MHYP_G00300290 [Metynnis hypsauchen]
MKTSPTLALDTSGYVPDACLSSLVLSARRRWAGSFQALAGCYGQNVSLTTQLVARGLVVIVNTTKNMAETAESKKDEADYKRLHSFPLIRHTDMPEEMRVETMELCVTACEKFATNNESAAKMIKESMDKKFGSSWHVVIGEGFGFEITHEVCARVHRHQCVYRNASLINKQLIIFPGEILSGEI